MNKKSIDKNTTFLLQHSVPVACDHAPFGHTLSARDFSRKGFVQPKYTGWLPERYSLLL